jgi:MFS family permease
MTTNSAFALGYLGLAGFLPAVMLILATGYVADHFDRRSILIASAMASGLTALCLLLLVTNAPQLVWAIYPIIICFAASRSFYNPASQALVPTLVPKEHLSKAIAFTTAAGQFATIAGPPIGGLLYWADPHLPFYAAVTCYILGAIASFAIRQRSAPVVATERKSWSTLVAGFTFAWSRPVVFGAITLDMFAVMLGGAAGLFPIYAKDILNVGPLGLSLMQAAPAVGSLLMSILLSRNKSLTQRHAGFRIFTTVACYGFAVIGFAFSTYFPLSLFFLFVAGGFDVISVVIRHTLVQAETPNEVRGRVARSEEHTSELQSPQS